jgi:hypothetical protein
MRIMFSKAISVLLQRTSVARFHVSMVGTEGAWRKKQMLSFPAQQGCGGMPPGERGIGKNAA